MSEQDSSPPAGYRVIPGYPRYAINEHGTVLSACFRGLGAKAIRSWANAKRLNSTANRLGYHQVWLYHDGRSRTSSVHTLVLTTFVGPCPSGMQCRHLDGNPSNNHVSNLAWGTASENEKDKTLHGTSCTGERHGRSKLKSDDVLEIRRRSANGEMLLDIAKDFPVSPASLSLIVRRDRWKHI